MPLLRVFLFCSEIFCCGELHIFFSFLSSQGSDSLICFFDIFFCWDFLLLSCVFFQFSLKPKFGTLGLVKKCFCWCFWWWYFLLLSYVFLQFSLKPKVRNSDPWLSMLLLMFLVMRFFFCASCRFLQFPLKPRLRNSDPWLNMILWFLFLVNFFFLLSCVFLHFTLKTRIRNSDPWLSMLLMVFFSCCESLNSCD